MPLYSTQPVKFLLVLTVLMLKLLLDVGQVLERVILSLHPEQHLLEWVACLLGGIAGQIFYKADTNLRVVGGLLIGYLAGLYGGADLAKKLSLDPDFGRFVAAALTDMLARLLEYVLRNFSTSVDFVIEKGAKITALLGEEMIGKGLKFIRDLFKKGA